MKGSNPAGVDIVFCGFGSLNKDRLANVSFGVFNKDWVVVGDERKPGLRSPLIVEEGWNIISLL